MKKLVIIVVLVAAVIAGAFYAGVFNRDTTEAAAPQAEPGGRAGGPGGFGAPGGQGGGRGGRGGPGGRFGGGGPMTVELGKAHKDRMSQQLTVVGNLIGDATVAVVPKVAGRLQDVYVRLGDRVSRGQRVAKIEDQELQEQVKQAQAASAVADATIRQREADLALAKTNVERSRSLFERQLLPKQTLDDNEARYQAALAQLDLARAQNTQSQARLEELKITLANTVIPSPVDGFVARRAADPGAFASQNAPVADIVDIRRVRLVVNVVEKDLRQANEGDQAAVNVDAFPGETFTGRIARVAPVLDPTTRTAPIEIEIPNADYRLKPGMYARVQITTDNQKETLVVPSNAVVDFNGRRGVFLAGEGGVATFRAVRVGIEEPMRVEIVEGLNEGDAVVTTGAAALTDGARFVVAGQGRGGNGRRGGQPGGPAAGEDGPSGAAATPGVQFRGEDGAPATGGRRGRNGGAQGADANASRGQRFGGAEGNGSFEGGRRGGRRGGVNGQAPGAGQPQGN